MLYVMGLFYISCFYTFPIKHLRSLLKLLIIHMIVSKVLTFKCFLILSSALIYISRIFVIQVELLVLV